MTITALRVSIRGCTRLAVAVVALLAVGSRDGSAQTIPTYLQQIVQYNAPLIIEETDNSGGPNERAENHLMRLDFDGDYLGANNLTSANNNVYPNANPVVYYSVVETGDAYYIGYYFYHIQDGGSDVLWREGAHQHDLEGIWAIVEKSPYYPYGFNRLSLTAAHGAMLPFYDPAWFSQEPIVGIPGQLQAYPVGYIRRWVDPTGVSRPVVAIRRSTHGTYMAQACDVADQFNQQDGMQLNRQPNGPYVSCIHNDAEAMVYSPEPWGCSPYNGCLSPPVPASATLGSYYYDLVSMFDDPAFWPTRQTPNGMFNGSSLIYLGGNQWGYHGFHGTDSDTEANPPWAWDGGSGAHTVLNQPIAWYSFEVDNTGNYYDKINWPQWGDGPLLTSPVTLASDYFAWQSWNTTMYYNPFVGGAGSHPPDLSVWIDGPTYFNDAQQSGTWTANVSGGTPPYTYQWSGAFYGTDASVSGTVTSSNTLYLDVWDAAGVHIAVSTSLTYCPGFQETC
jgi:hypothetical protein